MRPADAIPDAVRNKVLADGNVGWLDDLPLLVESLAHDWSLGIGASLTGVDVTAIWEWGTVHRVASGLYGRSVGFQPFGDLLLAAADRLSAG